MAVYIVTETGIVEADIDGMSEAFIITADGPVSIYQSIPPGPPEVELIWNE